MPPRLPDTAASGFNEAGILHPEKRSGAEEHLYRTFASMRPGFYTRKSIIDWGCTIAECPRFNEAGILHPEKRTARPHQALRCLGFNEAGILHPEKLGPASDQLHRHHASMRPGFYTRKSVPGYTRPLQTIKASMRPGFYTRKSSGLPAAAIAAPVGFNEAGILHPEKRGCWWRSFPPRARFNEAGILHPEKLRPRRGVLAARGASMRPGFYTRKSQGVGNG